MNSTMHTNYNLITILGPTASGKTTLAAHVAYQLHSAVISGDSRQVYKGMDIGTGKDISDYTVNNTQIPYYLTDIVEAGTKYNVYEFQKDFIEVFNQLVSNNKIPVLCGGSGLYIESVLKGYKLISVPVNDVLRNELNQKTDDELIKMLAGFKKMHNTSDITTRKRLVRAIEIEIYNTNNPQNNYDFPEIKSLLVGICFEREEQKKSITRRLHARLKEGMIDEVDTLLKKGISPDDLIYYGLEYKFITQYLIGQLNYDDMLNLLNIAIHQFSKRQMTWFRKMEREGFNIHWLNAKTPLNENIEQTLKLLYQ
jgi:tRNA dimethylallyltransferase